MTPVGRNPTTVMCKNGHILYTLDKPIAHAEPVYASRFSPVGDQPPLRDGVPPSPCHVCGDGMWFDHLLVGIYL